MIRSNQHGKSPSHLSRNITRRVIVTSDSYFDPPNIYHEANCDLLSLYTIDRLIHQEKRVSRKELEAINMNVAEAATLVLTAHERLLKRRESQLLRFSGISGRCRVDWAVDCCEG